MEGRRAVGAAENWPDEWLLVRRGWAAQSERVQAWCDAQHICRRVIPAGTRCGHSAEKDVYVLPSRTAAFFWPGGRSAAECNAFFFVRAEALAV